MASPQDTAVYEQLLSHFIAEPDPLLAMLEWLNREIRRRSRVASPFPNLASYLRLITCYLIEYTEDWSTGRSYISPTKIEDRVEAVPKAA